MLGALHGCVYCLLGAYAYFGAVMPNENSSAVVNALGCAGRRCGVFTASLACFLAAVSVAVLGLTHLADALIGDTSGSAASVGTSTKVADAAPSSAVLDDGWLERISRESTWRAGRSGSAGSESSKRKGASRLQGPPPETQAPAPTSWFMTGPSDTSPWWADDPDGASKPAPRKSRGAGGYRTVCVRLCDGSFFPVSYGASESRFSRDQSTCSSTCPGSRLFYYRPSSQDSDEMVDVNGQPYSKLQNANLYRTQYVPSCKCKPHPWEQAAVDRHRIYALEDQRRRGSKAVVAELEELKARNRVVVTRTASQKRENSRGKRRGPPAQMEVAAAPQPASTEQNIAPRSDATRGQGGSVISSSIVAAASVATVQALASNTPPADNSPSTAESGPTITPTHTASAAGSPRNDLTEPPLKSPIAGLPLTVKRSRAGPPPVDNLPLTAPAPALAPLPTRAARPTVAAEAQEAGPRNTRRSGKVERKRSQTTATRPTPAPRRTAEWARGVFAPF